MTHFEYVIVLVSIVLGLSITKLLTGVGEMLQARGHAKQYWVHNVWVANAFVSNLLVWWVAYRWVDWEKEHEWNFFLFVFMLLTPIVQFLLAVLLFPEEIPHGQNMKEHFVSIQRTFFLLFAALPVIDIADSLIKGTQHFHNLGPAYVPSMLTIITGSIIAAFTKRRHFHASFGVVYLVITTIYVFSNLRTLQ